LKKTLSLALPAVLLSMVIAGCHNEEGCGDNALRSGVRFEITVTQLKSSHACSAPTASVDDTLVFTTGTPVDTGPNAVCTHESFQGPEGVSELYGVAFDGECSTMAHGASCAGQVTACPGQEVTLNLYVSIPVSRLEQVGDEGEGEYTVSFNGREQDGCPGLACLETFDVRARRLN